MARTQKPTPPATISQAPTIARPTQPARITNGSREPALPGAGRAEGVDRPFRDAVEVFFAGAFLAGALLAGAFFCGGRAGCRLV